MTLHPPFGQQMLRTHFLFHPSYTPLNHGSFGAYPLPVQTCQTNYNNLAHSRPDTFIVSDLPKLINKSREALAPLLGAHVDEIVLVPNATTGVNTVLRNIRWEEGDVILYFSTIYDSCHKTIAHLSEMGPVRGVGVTIEFPITEEEIVQRFRKGIDMARRDGKKVRIAMFDTVLTFPGVRLPWEKLVEACTELGVLSLIDGAHGIGHIDLTHLGQVQPDFFVSNCHKWLYTPRSCAVFYVPFKNQHLIRTSLPTSHGYSYPPSKISSSTIANSKSNFTTLFEFVATIDYSPYLCIPAAIEFRKTVCGGEEKIRSHCYALASQGGKIVAQILGTHVLANSSGKMDEVCFTNVALPLAFRTAEDIDGKDEKGGNAGGEISFSIGEAGKIGAWINRTAVEEYDTYLQIAFHSGYLWVRLSAQIYLEVKDFEWVAQRLDILCQRLRTGEVVL